MLRSLKKNPEHAAALDRVQQWTRERFRLGDDAAVGVAEVACGLPGCAPLETLVVFWTSETKRHQFKIFKRTAEVTREDLPFAWLKDALAVPEGADGDCC